MRLSILIFSVLGSFSAYSQQAQPEVQPITPINGVATTTQVTTGNTTIITNATENKLDVQQLQRPERVVTKPHTEEELKKNPINE
jgi:hypothetical protein